MGKSNSKMNIKLLKSTIAVCANRVNAMDDAALRPHLKSLVQDESLAAEKKLLLFAQVWHSALQLYHVPVNKAPLQSMLLSYKS